MRRVRVRMERIRASSVILPHMLESSAKAALMMVIDEHKQQNAGNEWSDVEIAFRIEQQA